MDEEATAQKEQLEILSQILLEMKELKKTILLACGASIESLKEV